MTAQTDLVDSMHDACAYPSILDFSTCIAILYNCKDVFVVRPHLLRLHLFGSLTARTFVVQTSLTQTPLNCLTHCQSICSCNSDMEGEHKRNCFHLSRLLSGTNGLSNMLVGLLVFIYFCHHCCYFCNNIFF